MSVLVVLLWECPHDGSQGIDAVQAAYPKTNVVPAARQVAREDGQRQACTPEISANNDNNRRVRGSTRLDR